MTASVVVAAGGIAPGSPPAGASGVDTVEARRYAHPALGSRAVIRLVPQALGGAEDQAAEFLGFTRVAEPIPVGQGQQRALGFPGWALVHDPANGRHALAMVKALEGLARLARSKPGNAEAGYLHLASTLDASVPQFLPTFWEEAGRAYLAADNPRQAAACFGRAREAERIHALVVDEERLGQVHLEFALRGALSAKTLTQYGQELATRNPPAQAYAQFVAVARQRIAGGLPPHAGLAADLKRLARAAGLRPDAELGQFVVDILWMPAVLKAAIGFWSSFSAPLRQLVRDEPGVRHRLLSIMPDAGAVLEVAEGWIAFLTEVGALASLLDPADTTVCATEWLGRLCRHRERYWRRQRSTVVIELVGRMVPRLRAEAMPIELFGRADEVDLDLLDLCRQEGLEVVASRGRYRLNLRQWCEDRQPGARDLLALATDPTYHAMFRQGVRDLLAPLRPGPYGQPLPAVADSALAVLIETPGIRQSIVDWLTECADLADGAPLAALVDLLTDFYPFATAAGTALAPDAVARLAAADPAAALGRTLRTGLISEYGWPAYEEATARLKGRVQTSVTWPYVVVWDDTLAVVVGPAGIVLEHPFRRSPGPGPANFRLPPQVSYVDGQLLVASQGIGRPRAYWTGSPQDEFDYRGADNRRLRFGAEHRAPMVVRLSDVTTTGGRPWRAGDRRAPDQHPIATDGTGTWRCERSQGPTGPTWRWREYNPHTGAAGRVSAPSFLDQPGLVVTDGTVNAAPAEFAASPLGFADGLVGWRVRANEDATFDGEGIDGRRVSWRPDRRPSDRRLVGALVDEVAGVRPVVADGHRIELWSVDGTHPASRIEVGRSCPPLDLWHAMVPRDEAGSAVLRALTDPDAARLLDALSAVPAEDRFERDTEVLGPLLPGLTDRVLRNLVAYEVGQAVWCAEVLAQLRGHLDQAGAAPRPAVGRSPAIQRAVFSVFHTGLTGQMLATVLGQIQAAGRALAGGEPDPAVFANADHELDWPAALLVLPALLARALSPLTDEDERAGIVALLQGIAETRLVYFEAGGATRLVRATRTVAANDAVLHPPGTVLRSGGRSAIVLSYTPIGLPFTDERTDRLQILERSDNGDFGPFADYTVTEDLRFASGDPEHLASIAGRVAAEGPLPWRPELVTRLARETSMSRAEAAFVLAGLPGLVRGGGGPDDPVRDRLGLKVNEARTARRRLAELPTATLFDLLGAAGAAEADRLWRDGPNVDRIVEVWREAHGDPDPDLDLRRVLELPSVRGTELPVAQLATPDTHPWLTRTGLWADDRPPALTVALLWLAYQLPVGQPIRAGLPGAYRRIRSVLADPQYLAVGYGPATDPGLPGLRLTSTTGYRPRYELDTHRLTGPRDPALRVIHRPDLVLLLEPSVQRLMDFIADPAAAGPWPQDPRVSRPDLVAAVAHRHGLGRDAAAYYLQLLALPDPTDANVRRWNAWSTSDLQAARAEVAATPLVLTARRERAGRDLFLPGGWLPQREPNRPLERWKEHFLLMYRDYSPVLGVILIDRPIPELFGDAWQRVLDGDEPRYTDLGGGPG